MTTLNLKVARGIAQTGGLLTALLMQDYGITVAEGDGLTVCYGVPHGGRDKYTLNGRAGVLNKLEELQTLATAGVSTPRFYEASGIIDLIGTDTVRMPLLGRKARHTRGRDIRPVLQEQEIPWRIASGSEFFVEFIPWVREYRVWVYRRRHLGTYEKRMTRPVEYTRIGSSSKNGFGFYIVPSDEVPRRAVHEAAHAVDALGLDFGAVDILEGKDGKFYVLEVNTAPGVESTERQVIKALAKKIAMWAEAPTERRTVDWSQEEVAA